MEPFVLFPVCTQGGISDKEITRCSRILDLLEPGDSVMADKGFDINDLLREHNVLLNILPSLESQVQFSPQDDQQKPLSTLKYMLNGLLEGSKNITSLIWRFLYLL